MKISMSRMVSIIMTLTAIFTTSVMFSAMSEIDRVRIGTVDFLHETGAVRYNSETGERELIDSSAENLFLWRDIAGKGE